MTWKQGAREEKGLAQRQDRGRSSLEAGRPVRDQGGIKAGPRRDHILFHLILTDYQLLLFSCILSSYRHLHYISHPRYSASDWGRSLILAAPRPPTRLPALSSCEGCFGATARTSTRAAASDAALPFRDNSGRDTACCLPILLSPMTTFNPATGYFFYSRWDRTWRRCEDSFMYMFIFPPPVIGMLAAYL